MFRRDIHARVKVISVFNNSIKIVNFYISSEKYMAFELFHLLGICTEHGISDNGICAWFRKLLIFKDFCFAVF